MAWCETDVINSNKSTVVRLCLDQQLRRRLLRESVNMIDKILIFLLIFYPIMTTTSDLGYLERFDPLYRLREPAPSVSTAAAMEHQILLRWP